MQFIRAQELCESQSGRPGIPTSNSLYGLCGRQATLNSNPQQSISFPLFITLLHKFYARLHGSPHLYAVVNAVNQPRKHAAVDRFAQCVTGIAWLEHKKT